MIYLLVSCIRMTKQGYTKNATEALGNCAVDYYRETILKDRKIYVPHFSEIELMIHNIKEVNSYLATLIKNKSNLPS
jgi:hypothetical protein